MKILSVGGNKITVTASYQVIENKTEITAASQNLATGEVNWNRTFTEPGECDLLRVEVVDSNLEIETSTGKKWSFAAVFPYPRHSHLWKK